MHRDWTPASDLHKSDAIDLLRQIHWDIGSNVESQALSIMNEEPPHLEEFWSAIKPDFERFIRPSSIEIRRTADTATQGAIYFSDHLPWLASNGFSREDSRQIRYVIESFYNLEPIFALFAWAAAKRLLWGAASCWVVPRASYRTQIPAWFRGDIRFVERPPVANDESITTHPLMRALAVWPGYTGKIYADLDSVAQMSGLSSAARAVRRAVEHISGDADSRADFAAAQAPNLAVRMISCLHTSAQAIALASALRRGFIESEIIARRQ